MLPSLITGTATRGPSQQGAFPNRRQDSPSPWGRGPGLRRAEAASSAQAG